MSVRILGIGTALPSGTLSADEFADLACGLCARAPREAALVRGIVRQTGIENRHSVLAQRGPDGRHRAPFYQERPEGAPRSPTTAERMAAYARHAPPLAAEALRNALEDANVDSGEIAHIVVATCTGFFSPGLDFALIDAFGLRPSTSRTLLGFMGCHGAINALATGAAAAKAKSDSVVAVVSVELCTLHFQFGLDRDALLPNALFSDAAGAVVLKHDNDALSTRAFELVDCESFVLPDSRDAMTWTVGDTGFRMTLDSSVPDRIRAAVGPLVDGFLARHGLARSDVRRWAIHPGGPRVLDACVQALGLDERAASPSRDFLRRAGNASSASIIHILADIAREPARGPTVAIAFGPGLVAEMALLD